VASSAAANSGDPDLGSVGVKVAANGFMLLFRLDTLSSESVCGGCGIKQSKNIYHYQYCLNKITMAGT
jgi:hypothetical protein